MSVIYWISTSSTDFNTGANWSGAAVPTTGDDVVIQAIPGSALANIAAFDASAVTLASLTISATYTGTIGNAGAGGYLKISTTVLTIGTPAADGSNPGGAGRIKIDLGSVQSTITILQASNNATDSNTPPILLKGTNASNKLSVLAGKVGIAANQPGETSTLTQLDVVGNNAYVVCGSGVTLTTVGASGGGQVTTNAAVTTLTVGTGSKATCYGVGKVTTINNNGTVYHGARTASGNSSDTINNYANGLVDFSVNPAAGTVGTFNGYSQSSHIVNGANPSHITLTALALKNVKQLALA